MRKKPKYGIYFSFSDYWWIIISIFVGLWLILFYLQPETQSVVLLLDQVIFALIITALAVGVEFIAITFSLWSYAPGNWPYILWIGYFLSGLLAFQISFLVQKIFS